MLWCLDYVMVSLLLLHRPGHTQVTVPLPTVYKPYVQNTTYPQSELRLCYIDILVSSPTALLL